MGWIEDQFENWGQSRADQGEAQAERTFEAKAAEKWRSLMAGFAQDAEEYKRLGGAADFAELSDVQCRISNHSSRTAVLVSADLNAHTIEYTYEPESEGTAVPEGGVLSLRDAPRSVDLYSADQRLNFEQARRLILEPLLFPSKVQPLPRAG